MRPLSMRLVCWSWSYEHYHRWSRVEPKISKLPSWTRLPKRFFYSWTYLGWTLLGELWSSVGYPSIFLKALCFGFHVWHASKCRLLSAQISGSFFGCLSLTDMSQLLHMSCLVRASRCIIYLHKREAYLCCLVLDPLLCVLDAKGEITYLHMLLRFIFIDLTSTFVLIM